MATEFGELGIEGLDRIAGWVQEAYTAKLYWPDVWPIYNRLRRSDAEVTIARNIMGMTAQETGHEWIANWNDVTPEEIAFRDFCETATLDADFDGEVRDVLVANVPFHGWGVWEVLAGMREPDWKVPGGQDDWRSQYDDGLVGIRRFSWRSQGTLESWKWNDAGRAIGMWQNDINMPRRELIPFERALHITHGDTHNPEGLALLETIYRRDRLKTGFEVVNAFGLEHAAGYVKFKVLQNLTIEDNALLRSAARVLSSAKEGQYITEIINKFEADMIDVPFSAASSVLESIRYYSLVKLQVFNMIWVAIASTSGSGAFAAVKDLSAMYIQTHNAMMTGFYKQAGRQIAKWLQVRNSKFESVRRLPVLTPMKATKQIDLTEYGDFLTKFNAIFPLFKDDAIAIRSKVDVLPENPEGIEDVMTSEPEEEEVQDETDSETDDVSTESNVDEEEGKELSSNRSGNNSRTNGGTGSSSNLAFRRPLAVSPDEQPIDVTDEAIITEADINRALRNMRKASGTDELNEHVKARERKRDIV